MNFEYALEKGKRGEEQGLSLGSGGLQEVSKTINGLQKGRVYAIGAAPKAKENGAFSADVVINNYVCIK